MRPMAVLLASLLGAVPVAAQARVGPTIGAMLYDGSLLIREGGIVVGDGLDESGPKLLAGIRAAVSLGERLEVEAGYDQSWLENSRGGLTSHFYRVGVNWLLPFAGSVTAAVGASVGGVTFRPDDGSALSDPTFGLAGGIRYPFSQHVELYSDLRFTGQLCGDTNPSGLSCNDGSQLGYSQLGVGIMGVF